jgi:cytochrome bd-type quinol oxidase subunit 2
VIEPTVLLSIALVLSLTAYALLGGADYGGGVWDLLASGKTAERQRATIAHAIGPVWEANHVWLIVAIVILFTGFPRAFAAVSTHLHVPLLLVLFGIVLRGAAFVFRAYGPDDPHHERFWGRVFAIASTTTPFFLGVIAGAVTEGKLSASPQGSFSAVYVTPWLTPFSLSVGVFALVLFAYLAAVYLTLETEHSEEGAAFRTRALLSGLAAGVLAATVLLLATADVRNALVASAAARGHRRVSTRGIRMSLVAFVRMRAFRSGRTSALHSVGLGPGAVSLRDSAAPHLGRRRGTGERAGAVAPSARRWRCGLGSLSVVPVRDVRTARQPDGSDMSAMQRHQGCRAKHGGALRRRTQSRAAAFDMTRGRRRTKRASGWDSPSVGAATTPWQAPLRPRQSFVRPRTSARRTCARSAECPWT